MQRRKDCDNKSPTGSHIGHEHGLLCITTQQRWPSILEEEILGASYTGGPMRRIMRQNARRSRTGDSMSGPAHRALPRDEKR